MKVATRGQLEAVAHPRLQFGAPFLDQIEVKVEVAIGVRRGHHMRDAFGDGHFGHLHGFVEGLRAIVERGKNVAMDIDHQPKSIAERSEPHNHAGMNLPTPGGLLRHPTR